MPRVKDNRKKRKWELSTATIAEATGKSARVVRRDINAGKCTPWDLRALSQYILLHALKKGVLHSTYDAHVASSYPLGKRQANTREGVEAVATEVAPPPPKPPAPSTPPPPAVPPVKQAPVHIEKKGGVYY